MKPVAVTAVAPIPKPHTPLAPCSLPEMQSHAEQRTLMSIEALEDIVRHGEKDSDRIAAAIALMDRAHGKPMQGVVVRTNAGNTIDAMYHEVKAYLEPPENLG